MDIPKPPWASGKDEEKKKSRDDAMWPESVIWPPSFAGLV
jgi:hypothetical protein